MSLADYKGRIREVSLYYYIILYCIVLYIIYYVILSLHVF